MKNILCAFLVAFCCIACGGTYSVATGVDDTAQLSFSAASSYDVTVQIDGETYQMSTVKKSAIQGRKMNATAKNTITIGTGKHQIKVSHKGQEIYSKEIFVSTGQHKIIEL